MLITGKYKQTCLCYKHVVASLTDKQPDHLGTESTSYLQ